MPSMRQNRTLLESMPIDTLYEHNNDAYAAESSPRPAAAMTARPTVVEWRMQRAYKGHS
jgi:hypothetical protein